MPNWVYNRVSVSGSNEDLLELRRQITKQSPFNPDPTEITFHSWVTLSDEEIIEHSKDEQAFDWYDWHNAAWHTKWDACNADVQYSVSNTNGDLVHVYMSFETAWSPPIPVLEAMVAVNPNLS